MQVLSFFNTVFPSLSSREYPSLFSSAGAAVAAAPPSYESVVPFGLVPGDLLTPAASAAIAEVESSFQGAVRLAAMRAVQRSRQTNKLTNNSLEGTRSTRRPSSLATSAPLSFLLLILFLLQRAVITAALATAQPEALRSVAIAHAHTLAERRPSFMLLSGYPVSAGPLMGPAGWLC